MINVNGRFLTQESTGAQRYAREITRRLVNAHGDTGIRVLVPPSGDQGSGDLAAVISRVGSLHGHPWEQLELGRRVNRDGGVLWSPANVGPVNAKRHVVTIHDVFSIQFPQWVGKRFHLWYSFLLPRLANATSHIITVSEYSRAAIVETLGVSEEKVSVVYPGVDKSFAAVDAGEMLRARERYGLPERFVLTLGSLEPRKNLERVVAAWLRLEEHIRLPLIIAGAQGSGKVFGGYDTEKLLRHEEIQLIGYVAEEDLPGLYASSTVFVYASLLEGFGLPPLEAMACGATVVTSGTSAMRETSEGEAIMVDPESVESIADGLAYALQMGFDPAGRTARAERTRSRFDWENTAGRINDILRRYE